MRGVVSGDTGGGTPVRILGIDPGTRIMGFGVLELGASHVVTQVEAGALRLSGTMEARLEAIFHGICDVVERTRPRVMAIESVFHGKNFESALKLGQARGVVMLVGQMAKLGIREFAPASVKKAVTGSGAAGKEQVQRFVTRHLKLTDLPSPTDVSDALAVAFCCVEALWREERLSRTTVGASAKPA